MCNYLPVSRRRERTSPLRIWRVQILVGHQIRQWHGGFPGLPAAVPGESREDREYQQGILFPL